MLLKDFDPGTLLHYKVNESAGRCELVRVLGWLDCPKKPYVVQSVETQKVFLALGGQLYFVESMTDDEGT